MKLSSNINIVIVGVGGQGTLLASKILGNLALINDCGIKVSEVHGMSQRGGSVITHVRIGNNVNAPLVAKKSADYLLSFEALEAARAADYLKEDGTLIVNIQQILPMPVITGASKYPTSPLKEFYDNRLNVKEIDALKIALEQGDARAVNMVLLGMLSNYLPFNNESWEYAIKNSIKPATYQTNIKAFTQGKNA